MDQSEDRIHRKNNKSIEYTKFDNSEIERKIMECYRLKEDALDSITKVRVVVTYTLVKPVNMWDVEILIYNKICSPSGDYSSFHSKTTALEWVQNKLDDLTENLNLNLEVEIHWTYKNHIGIVFPMGGMADTAFLDRF